METYRPFEDNAEYRRIVAELLDRLGVIPEPFRSLIGQTLRELMKMLEESRYPRFAILGRRGAGKTMLMHAIFGEPVGEIGPVRAQTGATRWRFYQGVDERGMHILDTRGLQEGARPVEHDAASTPEDSILNAFEGCMPDAILFLVKAKEVNAAIDGDLTRLEQILGAIRTQYGARPAVIGIVTQCDELDPSYIKTEKQRRERPDKWAEKQTYIAQAAADLERHFKRYKALGEVGYILPISAHVCFRPDGTAEPESDYRWNIDTLLNLLIEQLPSESQLQFARIARMRHYQEQVARRIVHLVCGAAGAVGAAPIPMADLPILTAMQIFMVMMIAYISGRPFSLESARDLLIAAGVNMGAGYMLRELARGFIKLVSLAGLFVSGGIVTAAGAATTGALAAAGTKAIGEAAIAYFIRGAKVFGPVRKVA
jgi:uncharacterized protein (DUF697 family)/predicted GTPase